MGAHRYVATHGKDSSELKLEDLGGGRYRLELDGEAHDVDAVRFSGGSWSVLIDGQSYDLELEVASGNESDGQYNILVRGEVVHLTVQDERRRRMSLTSKKLGGDAPPVLNAPMPGKVVKIFVGEGDEVAEGAPVLVMEAMKMENELRVPSAGRVSRVHVKEGQPVESGAPLITFSPVEAERPDD